MARVWCILVDEVDNGDDENDLTTGLPPHNWISNSNTDIYSECVLFRDIVCSLFLILLPQQSSFESLD